MPVSWYGLRGVVVECCVSCGGDAHKISSTLCGIQLWWDAVCLVVVMHIRYHQHCMLSCTYEHSNAAQRSQCGQAGRWVTSLICFSASRLFLLLRLFLFHYILSKDVIVLLTTHFIVANQTVCPSCM